MEKNIFCQFFCRQLEDLGFKVIKMSLKWFLCSMTQVQALQKVYVVFGTEIKDRLRADMAAQAAMRLSLLHPNTRNNQSGACQHCQICSFCSPSMSLYWRNHVPCRWEGSRAGCVDMSQMPRCRLSSPDTGYNIFSFTGFLIHHCARSTAGQCWKSPKALVTDNGLSGYVFWISSDSARDREFAVRLVLIN